LANSSSVRLTQFFPLDETVTVFCNRGTCGIDGSLSSAVGFAAASEELSFLLIGDLSFFYDSNGIWNKHVGRNFRVLLNNNGGAGIFHLTIGEKKIPTINQNIAAAHKTSAKAWAESMGFYYLSASNERELKENLPHFVRINSERPILLEVFTDMNDDAKARKDYEGEKSPLLKIQEKAIKKFSNF
jgi:2-succinyl-5-enolpyruvyl-6-hydroxy-3-cyclohexene-1-carboxylate synthase